MNFDIYLIYPIKKIWRTNRDKVTTNNKNEFKQGRVIESKETAVYIQEKSLMQPATRIHLVLQSAEAMTIQSIDDKREKYVKALHSICTIHIQTHTQPNGQNMWRSKLRARSFIAWIKWTTKRQKQKRNRKRTKWTTKNKTMRQLATRKATGRAGRGSTRGNVVAATSAAAAKGNSYTNCKEIKF